ncbi:hypothetical protein [Streptomyces rubellomurinus]|nr:hypothetical protein [Streptomyces rubellomurinus]
MSTTNDPEEVLLVTGGGRGIGAATALLAARRGYHRGVPGGVRRALSGR